jgi:uridine kinase
MEAMELGKNQVLFERKGASFMPQLIGIVGGSCAGKSWLAEHLEKMLAGFAGRLSLDDFYRDRSHLSPARRARINFDHPRSIDWATFKSVLRSCAEGHKTLIPQYDFETHARRSMPRAFKPAPLILCEGLWLFRNASLRRLFALKIFIRSPLNLCKRRRMDRDLAERGRSIDEIEERFDTMVAPMNQRFVTPQERWADVVLREAPTVQSVEALAGRLRELLNPPRIVL